jgi:hypothetical protein
MSGVKLGLAGRKLRVGLLLVFSVSSVSNLGWRRGLVAPGKKFNPARSTEFPAATFSNTMELVFHFARTSRQAC